MDRGRWRRDLQAEANDWIELLTRRTGLTRPEVAEIIVRSFGDEGPHDLDDFCARAYLYWRSLNETNS